MAPVIVEKIFDLVNDFVVSHLQQTCATKCAAASKAVYGAGVKVGILYGAGAMLLLVVVIGGIIFVIQQVKQSQKLAYAI